MNRELSLRSEEINYEAIKRDISITEVLSRYTRVYDRKRYRVACPIHGGDGYNFAVDEDKGLFHCFSCSAAGDVVSLYALMENISNSEAAKRLIQEYRVDGSIPYTPRQTFNEVRDWSPKGPLPEIELPPSRVLNGYRRFTKAAIDHFDLRLIDSGVLLPIKDINGRMVGYAIRQINILPKYLNSKDFRKSEALYALWENKAEIKSQGFVVITEGQFSAIRCWDSGYQNVIATMGRTMSPTQAHLLADLVGRIVVLYDGDERGREGARKIKETYSALFAVEVKDLPEGTDPDNADLGAIFNDTKE